MTGCDKCSCNQKVEKKYREIKDEPNTPPGIGFSFAMCHSPLSQEAAGFRLLVASGPSKRFINSASIRVVESRMLKSTRTEPPMEITAVGDSVLGCTAQGILLFVVRSTDNVLRTVISPTVLVPGSKSVFSQFGRSSKRR